MRKIYSIIYAIIIAFIFLANNVYAQAPVFTYPDTLRFSTGQTINPPIAPTGVSGLQPSTTNYSLTSNLAGSGFYGHKDTLAAFASFTNPVGIAKFNGIIYVADANSNCIRKIQNGLVTTFAGSVNGDKGGKNGQDTAARFNYPTSVAVDADGNVYVTDFLNSLIRKITPQGFVSTFAGDQNNGYLDARGKTAKFNLPYAICTDVNNNYLWVADTYNQRIRKISLSDTTVTTAAGTYAIGAKDGSTDSATFNVPKGITMDRSGMLYITEEANNTVRKFNPSTRMVSTFAKSTLVKPIGVAVDIIGNVYVSCEEKFGIYKFGPDGKLADSTRYPAFSGGNLKGYADGTDTLAKYSGNMGLFFDQQPNNLIVSDPGSDHIRQVSLNGYSIYPRLPDGLIFNNGAISGTPTTISPAKNYIIDGYSVPSKGSFTTNLAVVAGQQVITFNPPPAYTYGDKDTVVTVTSNSAAQIILSSDNPKVATIVKNKIHIVGAGVTNITASQPANANFAAATPVTQPLTINKAKLSASVYRYYKTLGKDNPNFTIYYYGYVNGDTTSVLKTLPTATTTAVTDSPLGDYPITVSGGSADNYSFTYNPGTLTVIPTPVITSTGATSIAKGDSVLLTITPSSGYALQWYFNGSAIKEATSATYYAKEVGTYTASISINGYTFTSLYIPLNVQLVLPADNFSIKATSVSCKGDNDGSIAITAKQSLKYEATVTINGVTTQYPFTNSWALNNLSPGNYSVCIGVDNELFNQCYQLTVTEPKDLSVYSVVNKSSNTINLQLDGGSSFNINLNDKIYTTDKNEISLPLVAGINKLVITTDKLCQGVIEKNIDMTGITAPYPNPFTDILNVNVGSGLVSNLKVDVVNVINGKSVYTDLLTNKSGVLQFDLSGIAGGVYYFNLNLDNRKLGYKIIKK
ncbi:MBG domain-containing protein [Mucilaginibacter sp. dw_454]|uniref:MBG domain-containing protein n=1 Tax=Mucilaginibacter sp. dw_454 TaxID=2720079 RepID=UPI001BD34FB3|nr:MBG domain-containing protein [Mucilaginibacter sp. dw_454]